MTNIVNTYQRIAHVVVTVFTIERWYLPEHEDSHNIQYMSQKTIDSHPFIHLKLNSCHTMFIVILTCMNSNFI